MTDFEQALEKNLEMKEEKTFQEMKSTEEILEKIVELTMKDLNKKALMSFYFKERLKFLMNSENENHQLMLQQMYQEKKLLTHLLEIEKKANEFTEKMKPEMMKNFGIMEELKVKDQMKWVGLMNNLNTTLKKMTLE
ncbi:TnpV protein [Mycoplasmopsis californica HAZ160_1]|uniref:TnpV protein n=1 Tax=Mycoplasmopsis californica HAZ160_1 TaxID=1397850 RepID=A0AAT9F8R6_9BACT|nr:TnpV protein [Mycoplasmopsis californica]BAP01221.1 TnpV protein [Mycoplasmopsis californica HAZ160_1]BBG41093.1 TnpV protein [Mycoplasmopsis californica]BBG41686.1 TnpV protein [Mycoplasmopsis californica]BBG42280.1 TnpV protein [Mycoplasmopsis californica]BBG42857.1 TnpV protein [Mycoplasmopsis californica]